MDKLFQKALEVARSFSVSTPADSIVLYSVSYLPTKENRDQAFAFVKQNPGKMMIEHTDCGAKLVELGMCSSDSGLSQEQVAEIWRVASKRFIKEASGEVRAFVKDADPRSVFRAMELPQLLENERITTINGEDKHKFAARFK